MIDRAAADPAVVDPTLDSRARSPSRTRPAHGARAARRTAAGRARRTGGCGPASAWCSPTSTGPGIVRHLWMTVPPAPPERLRALVLEVFYDDATEPSVSVPVLDFFGLPHGRLAAYESAYTHGARGSRAHQLPADAVRADACASSSSTRPTAGTILYFQLDYTLVPELARRPRPPARRRSGARTRRRCAATS